MQPNKNDPFLSWTAYAASNPFCGDSFVCLIVCCGPASSHAALNFIMAQICHLFSTVNIGKITENLAYMKCVTRIPICWLWGWQSGDSSRWYRDRVYYISELYNDNIVNYFLNIITTVSINFVLGDLMYRECLISVSTGRAANVACWDVQRCWWTAAGSTLWFNCSYVIDLLCSSHAVLIFILLPTEVEPTEQWITYIVLFIAWQPKNRFMFRSSPVCT